MSMITCRDEENRYIIEVPDGTQVRLDWKGSDWVLVQDPDLSDPDDPDLDGTAWLRDGWLISAARDEAYGLRIIEETPLGGEQEASLQEPGRLQD